MKFLCASTWEEDNSFLGGSCLCLCMFCHHCQSLLVSGDSDMTDQLRFVLPSYCIKCVFGQACLVKMAWHLAKPSFFGGAFIDQDEVTVNKNAK